MTGTDTGVGKTAVSCGILRLLRREGVGVGAFKPMESGWTGRGWPNDGRALATAAGLKAKREQVVPLVFRDAVAPLVGARLERTKIDWAHLDRAFAAMRDAHDLTIVEGSGGLAVPLTKDVTVADMAHRWGLPLLLVARAGLGTLNHSALTVEFARLRHLGILGIVLTGASKKPQIAERTNPQVLHDMTGVDVLGSLPNDPRVDVDADETEPMMRLVEKHVDLRPIRKLIA